MRRTADFAAAAERPKPSQRAQQRSFAATARAAYQQGIAAFEFDVDAAQQDFAVVAEQSDVFLWGILRPYHSTRPMMAMSSWVLLKSISNGA